MGKERTGPDQADSMKRAASMMLLSTTLFQGGCLSVSLPFTGKPLETFQDLRGWTFEGRLVGLESTWVHLETEQGDPFVVSIENFSPKEQSRIRGAKKLKEPPQPVRTADSSELLPRAGQLIDLQDGQPFTGRVHVRNRLGQLTGKLSCHSGWLHGVSTHYYEDGSPKAEVHYDQGQLHGVAVHWHDNGKTQSRGFYSGGQKDGLLETFHPSGKRESRSRWENGRPLGKHLQWHENGHAARETHYQDGQVRSDLQWTPYGELIRLDRQ